MSAQHAIIVKQKIDELRPRFVAMLSDRLDRFEQIRETLTLCDDPTTLLDELRFGTHRIVGLAATLGFDDLGALAQTVETTILRLREMQLPGVTRADLTPDDLLNALDDLLGEMALLVP